MAESKFSLRDWNLKIEEVITWISQIEFNMYVRIYIYTHTTYIRNNNFNNISII